MPTIKYPKNPNIDTAFVEQEDGTKNRALMTAPQDISTLEYPNNPNSTKGYVTVDGKKQRVILTADIAGGGGGDEHNLGWYATESALTTAHPTASNGDWAIVGATDTVWVWDSDTTAWVDSDQKGQVTSVNGQTGAVVLNASDVGAVPQLSTLPTAGADELGKVYQFVGTTGTYTHGYFYECVSDGQNPATYSWTQTNVQPAPSGLPDQTGHSGEFLTTDGTDASWAAISGGLPSQTGNSGKFLTTNGTDASWSNKPLVNNTVQTASLAIKGSTSASGTIAIGDDSGSTYQFAISIGNYAKAQALGAIQLGGHGVMGQRKNTDANTFKVGNANGNYEMMSADGTIPTARLTKVNTTATLTSAGWSGGSQTVTVTGVTATGIVFVSPDPTDQSAYTSAGIICSAQAANSLTFTCSTTPTADLSVNVVML